LVGTVAGVFTLQGNKLVSFGKVSKEIDNAIKYTKEGHIFVEVEKTDDKLIVKVKDTGIGISQEYIPKLFSPFTQEDTGYTRKFEGTGLGLALVKKYVEINKAMISVKSKKREGTQFTLIFSTDRK
jgi:signal transduction histidine kinase